MPVVTIDILDGKTDKEKETAIEKVTKAVSESFNIPKGWVQVVINEIPKQNWGKGGKSISKIQSGEK